MYTHNPANSNPHGFCDLGWLKEMPVTRKKILNLNPPTFVGFHCNLVAANFLQIVVIDCFIIVMKRGLVRISSQMAGEQLVLIFFDKLRFGLVQLCTFGVNKVLQKQSYNECRRGIAIEDFDKAPHD